MHVDVSFSSPYNKYDLSTIFMRNTEAKEEMLKSSRKLWEYRMKDADTEIIEDIKVSDIPSLKESDDKYKGLIIKGHLENFTKAKYEELPSKIINTEKLPYEKDYISADLIDNTCNS